MDRLGIYVQNYTCYNSVRPFGIVAIVGGIDDNGSHLYMIEPSGTSWGYTGAATVKHAARIIHQAHEDNKDKDYELEISWCSKQETNGRHESIPEDLLKEAIKFAQEDDEDDEDEEMS
ncbi:hypothetical protein QCA50_015926 [Cerrena zonata]|uniref:Uncharacterized protein n=1 Tax=Cerrena zonata TaxID=2478898 RepID=A0AAW0FJ43_9APHY